MANRPQPLAHNTVHTFKVRAPRGLIRLFSPQLGNHECRFLLGTAPTQPQGQELPAPLCRWRHAVPAVLLGTRCRHPLEPGVQGNLTPAPTSPCNAGISPRSMAAQAASAGPPASQGTLQGREDSYSGLILDPDTLPESPEEFAAELQTSLDAWRRHGYRGIWLKVPRERAHLVGHAVDAGFEFHHAEKVRPELGKGRREAMQGSVLLWRC